MNLGDEVDLEDYVSRPDKISAAEVRFHYSLLVHYYTSLSLSLSFSFGFSLHEYQYYISR